MIENLRRALRPLAIRLTNLIGRGVVKGIDDAKEVQELQVDLLDGETRDELERFGEYGFTSNPPKDTECVVVFVGGRRDQGYCLGTEDRRYRIKNLASGEVAVYDKTGSKIVLKANGDIELTPSSGLVKLTGDLEVTGSVAADGDVTAGAISLNSHTHGATGSLTYVNAAAIVTPVSGSTAGPS